MAEQNDKSLLEQAGGFLWDNLVWDSNASFLENAGWTALTVGSLAAIPFTGGLSATGLGVRAAAKVGAKTVFRAGEKSALGAAENVAARAAAGAAEKTAEKTAAKTGFWDAMKAPKPPSTGMVYASRAAGALGGAWLLGGMGYNWIENENNGGLLWSVVQKGAENIKALVEAGRLSKETLAGVVEAGLSLKKFVSCVQTEQDTAAVIAALGKVSNPSAEDLNRAKMVAVGNVLRHPQELGVRAALRQEGAEALFRDDKNARDLYLADGLVNDLISGAGSAVLKDFNAEVTDQDVKTFLGKMIQEGRAQDFFEKFPGLENGFRQKWPDLFEAPVPAAAQKAARDSSKPAAKGAEGAIDASRTSLSSGLDRLETLSGSALSKTFDTVSATVAKDDSWGAQMVGMALELTKNISSLFNALGMNDLADRFMRFSLSMAKGYVTSQFGDRFDLDKSAAAPKPAFTPNVHDLKLQMNG